MFLSLPQRFSELYTRTNNNKAITSNLALGSTVYCPRAEVMTLLDCAMTRQKVGTGYVRGKRSMRFKPEVRIKKYTPINLEFKGKWLDQNVERFSFKGGKITMCVFCKNFHGFNTSL